MWSLQSDWHRTLRVRASGETIVADLTDDTGWWRGSNLYMHSSGIYVLHEGQGGCIQFRAAPAVFLPRQPILCEKTRKPAQDRSPDPREATAGLPLSRYYPDLFYVGRFAEGAGKQQSLRFIGADEQPEMELPDIL